MEQLAQVVLHYARTLLDKMKVYEVKIEACKAQNKLMEAIGIALSVLKLLGVKLPEKPGKFYILRELIMTRLVLAGKQIEDLVNLPEMTDLYMLAAMRILSIAGSATCYTVPELVALIGLKLVRLSFKHGDTSASAFGYAAYGFVLCVVVGDIDSGYRFGKLGLRLLERFNVREVKARTLLVINGHARHWKEHIKETLSPLLEAYQNGLETGDFEYATLSALTYSHNSYLTGKNLVEIEQEIASYGELIKQLKQTTIYNNDPGTDRTRYHLNC